MAPALSGRACELRGVPRLPAGAVAWVLDDPRHVPYLMVWKDQRSEKLVEAVRVCAYSRSDSLDWTGWVEVKRTDGSHVLIRTIERPLPRNGGKVRVCCLSPLPETTACAVRMEGEPNTGQLCVPDIVGVSGVQRTSLCVRRWCTSLAAPSHCARREAVCYQRKRPASRVMLAVCFCRHPRSYQQPDTSRITPGMTRSQ